jgi:hypothetical protein
MDLQKRDRSLKDLQANKGSPNPIYKKKTKNDTTPETFKKKDNEPTKESPYASRNLAGAFKASNDSPWYTWNPRELNWQLGTPPPASELWLDLPPRVTNSFPIDTNKFSDPTLLALIDQGAEIWSLHSQNDPLAFSNAWATQISTNCARSNKKQRPFVQLACRLAVTPLESLPNITPDKLVPASPLVDAWIGSTKSFGLNADGPPPIFEKGQGLPKITPIGITARKLPFLIPRTHFRSPDKLFLEGYAGGHDACRSALLKLKNPSDCEQWKGLFASLAANNIRSFVDTQILVLGIRLSGTHPSFLPGWMNDQLPPSKLAVAWKGARISYSASWNPVANDTG